MGQRRALRLFFFKRDVDLNICCWSEVRNGRTRTGSSSLEEVWILSSITVPLELCNVVTTETGLGSFAPSRKDFGERQFAFVLSNFTLSFSDTIIHPVTQVSIVTLNSFS